MCLMDIKSAGDDVCSHGNMKKLWGPSSGNLVLLPRLSIQKVGNDIILSLWGLCTKTDNKEISTVVIKAARCIPLLSLGA